VRGPWLRSQPQKTLCSPPRPIHAADRVGRTDLWLRTDAIQPLVARAAGATNSYAWGGIGGGVQSGLMVVPTPRRHYRRRPAEQLNSLSEGPRHVEGFTIFHDVVARSRQLVRHCLDGDHCQGVGALLLVPALDRRVVAHREVRRLDEGPGQVLVAALGVAHALLLAVRFAPAVHRARIRGEVARAVEAADIACLQRNGQGEHLADAADGFERLVVRAQFGFGQDAALQCLDLAVQATHHCQVRPQGKLLFVEQRHRVDVLGLPALDLIAAGVRAEVACDQVAHAQDLHAALAHELAAFAQQIPHGAQLSRVDVAGGQDAQAQQVRQVARVAEVAAVLEAVVLFDGRGVDQMHSEAASCRPSTSQYQL
jgi:hypothetical protein